MKLVPLALIFASAIFYSTIRNKIDPTPTPLPTLGSTPQLSNAVSATPAAESDDPAGNAMVQQHSVQKPPPGGILNDKAKSLPQPEYPAAAKAVRASGTVAVQILIDKTGKVISASALSGHPLLRVAAEQAARKAEFEPTLLSEQPVTFSGVVTYKFPPQ